MSFKPHEGWALPWEPWWGREQGNPRDPCLWCQQSGAGVSVPSIWEMLVSIGTACGSAGFWGRWHLDGGRSLAWLRVSLWG